MKDWKCGCQGPSLRAGAQGWISVLQGPGQGLHLAWNTAGTVRAGLHPGLS